MPETAPDLTLVVPTYQESGNIVELLAGARAALSGRSWELLVVDDGSPDGTAAEASSFAASEPRVRVLSRAEKPRDLARSVALGFAAGRGRYLGSINADGSHDPADLPRLLSALDAGADAAVGSRYAPGGAVGSWPLARRAVSALGTALARAALGLPVRDPLSGYYVVARSVYERAGRLEDARGFKVLLELLARGRPERVVEVPIAFRDRKRGRSKMSARAAWQALAGLWRLSRAGGA